MRILQLLVLVAVPFGGLACGERAGPTAPYVPPEPKVEPVKPRDLVTDFDALCDWCLDASDKVSEVTRSNPIVGEELEKSKLEELRKLLIGKSVVWSINVEKIEPPQTIFLHSYHASPPPGSKYYGPPSLSVRFNHHTDLHRIERVPTDLMRRLKRDEPCVVTGKVTDVESSYTIWVEDTKLDLPSK